MRNGNTLVDRVHWSLTNTPMWVMWLIVLVWTIPSLSLFVNSFRAGPVSANPFWEVFGDGDRNYEARMPRGVLADDLFHMIENYCVF